MRLTPTGRTRIRWRKRLVQVPPALVATTVGQRGGGDSPGEHHQRRRVTFFLGLKWDKSYPAVPHTQPGNGGTGCFIHRQLVCPALTGHFPINPAAVSLHRRKPDCLEDAGNPTGPKGLSKTRRKACFNCWLYAVKPNVNHISGDDVGTPPGPLRELGDSGRHLSPTH